MQLVDESGDMRVWDGRPIHSDAQSQIVKDRADHFQEAASSVASHIDLLPHAIVSIAVTIFGVPARNAECVQAIAEGSGVTGDRQIDFAVALRKNVRLSFAHSFTTARDSRRRRAHSSRMC